MTVTIVEKQTLTLLSPHLNPRHKSNDTHTHTHTPTHPHPHTCTHTHTHTHTQSDKADDRMRNAIRDYRHPDDPEYDEDVNDAVEFVQDSVWRSIPNAKTCHSCIFTCSLILSCIVPCDICSPVQARETTVSYLNPVTPHTKYG